MSIAASRPNSPFSDPGRAPRVVLQGTNTSCSSLGGTLIYGGVALIRSYSASTRIRRVCCSTLDVVFADREDARAPVRWRQTPLNVMEVGELDRPFFRDKPNQRRIQDVWEWANSDGVGLVVLIVVLLIDNDGCSPYAALEAVQESEAIKSKAALFLAVGFLVAGELPQRGRRLHPQFVPALAKVRNWEGRLVIAIGRAVCLEDFEVQQAHPNVVKIFVQFDLVPVEVSRDRGKHLGEVAARCGYRDQYNGLLKRRLHALVSLAAL